MLKSILTRFTFFVAILLPIIGSSQTTLNVEWTGTPGELESTIMGDTTETGAQAHDIYMLEANKVYLQLSEINLYTSCSIVGAEPGEGEHPATIQPLPGDDGASQYTGWPNASIKTYGENQTYAFHNLLFNGVFADQSGTLFGVLCTYGSGNSITVDHVTSVHNQVITYFCFGQHEDWVLTDNTAVQYTCYPAGMFFGGFWWGGGGGWTGTVDNLTIRNNTIEGAHGQAFVIYDNGTVTGNNVVIDHNTFVNLIDWPKFYRHGNNTQWTNNLMVNTVACGQSHNSHGFGPTLNHPGGHGKMATLSQGACTDSTLLANGECWDNHNRNINYSNNAWMDTDELLAMFNMDPWCWDVTDTNDVVTTYCDTMVGGPGSDYESQSRWMDDSTSAQFANGVSESNNINATDLGLNLDANYYNAQIARTMDWLDNQVHDTYTDYWWTYQADGNHVVVEWPLPMDFSYSTSSAAATHCTHGGPVGSTQHMDHQAELGVDEPTLPNQFVLNQNYPNPFNPTTEIAFSMDKAADVSLTIYNVLGQKVRVLENASLEAGTHTYKWDGSDELGQSVSTGVYMYTLSDGAKSFTKKMALMK